MNGVLVDTSVWRKYFSGRIAAPQRAAMIDLLDQDDVILCHSAVIGELVLGGLSLREESLLSRLPTVIEVPNADMIAFVRTRKLTRRGIGWVDCQLLASAVLARAQLWTVDQRLAAAAARLRVDFAVRTR